MATGKDKPDYVRETHHEFVEASKVALANDRLQIILDKLGDTLAEKNREAWQALPAADELRERARTVKHETLNHLDEHLAALADKVESLGGHVYWADDAAAARETIVGILKQAGAKTVVKSKSMTSEEIHLNQAIEEAGVEPVETDFGEYIIQKAGHRPSHVVGPALHLSAQDVADILSEDPDSPLPAKREALAAFARRALRERFAEADVGISGVNFAVAETGTLVLVSNEGNGRLTTTLPRVHIALMGIEKVIPRLADLPLFLKVLARAATGQKITVYTSLLTGPRREEEHEGPEELHLVILDNGRSRILGGPLRESLFCIRCGACLNACPVYRSVGGHAYGGVYSGPIGAVLTPLYDGLSANHHLPHASSLCGACQAACPVKIAIPEMLVKLREQLHDEPGATGWWENLAYKFWAVVLARPWLYGVATWLATRLMGRAPGSWMKRLPGPLGGWTDQRDFPAPARQRFRDWWRSEGRP